MTVTTPQNTAFERPVAQKASPTSSPWTAAVRPVPISVENVTSRKRFRRISAFSVENGMKGRMPCHAPAGATSR